MKILLAGNHSAFEQMAAEVGVPYLMVSFYYTDAAPTPASGDDWKVAYRDDPRCRGIIVDSGAFTFIKDGASQDADAVDWYAYAEAYAEWVRDNDIQRWIELDLDGPKSYAFALELREYMTDIVGHPPIPVWHRSRGKQAFIQDAQNHDLVAMGGFPWNEIGPSEYYILPKFIKEAHKRGARIHGLGFQPGAGALEKYPFDSTDSTNWIFDSFGSWRKFDGRTLQTIDHEKKVGPEMYAHNVREWAKFARYMDGQNEPAIGTPW